jgi:hypothetical protein
MVTNEEIKMTNEITDCAIFSADFADDAEWNDEGDLIVPGGKAIATDLVRQLGKRGITAKQPIQHSYYAWLIEVLEGKIIVRCYLQNLEPWLLTTEAKGALFGGGKAKKEFHSRVVTALVDITKSDGRFSDVRWETKATFQSEGKLKR